MKKIIITSLFVIFSLFTLGAGVTIYNLVRITTDLHTLINLHEIEDIRQELSFNIQKIQNYTYAPAEEFSRNLDEIIAKASAVDNTIGKCHECHHFPDVQAELDETELLLEDYQEKLSYLITTATEGQRRTDNQEKVSSLSDVILAKVQGMVNRASGTLTRRTEAAMVEINKTYILLAFTLFSTLLASLIVARFLTLRVTRPIAELLVATQKIAAGDLEYRTDLNGDDEFNHLMTTFNEMSQGLSEKNEKIKTNLARLSQLNTLTLPLHTIQSMSEVPRYLKKCMNSLIDAEASGVLLADEHNHDSFVLHFSEVENESTAGARNPRAPLISISNEKVREIFAAAMGKPILNNTITDQVPLLSDIPIAPHVRNILIVWLTKERELSGALIFANKISADFTEEDLKVIGILGNNITVALDNLLLYRDLQYQMEELRKTQRQLVEAEKLTALGTLAGGVAHDFNNILCGMIGYVALLKRNHQPEDRDFKMLEVIEKAGFRAANLTKQLLTFARQEMTALKPVDLNENVRNVLSLFQNTINKTITIKSDLGEGLPLIKGDPAQLEQVVMNLCVNARDAMPDGGELLIRTEQIEVDQEFCSRQAQTEAQPGRYVMLTVADQGMGIDEKTLARIFEPFFTTKEFGKGTGLGLSMVYGITKSHHGFCTVSSTPGKGSRFSIFLPVLPSKSPGSSLENAQSISISCDAGITILIVDDEELISATLAEYLVDCGCKVMMARNGQEAIDQLGKNKEDIDLVILDINMPVMDGKEAFSRLKAIKPDLKVIIATGYAINDTARVLLEQGADDCIQKPYSLDDMSEKINRVMKGMGEVSN